MTPLPGALGGSELVGWRLDRAKYAPTWDSGEGAFQAGGRWNSAGLRAVYCAFDPATAILEVAVHKGFDVLDTDPHVFTRFCLDPSSVHVVMPGDVPNANWLRPGIPSAGQQTFGNDLLAGHAFIAIPSVVAASLSWNLVFVAANASGLYDLIDQQPFALDTRLNPPAR